MKLNRVIGWRPEPYDSIEQIREVDSEAAQWIKTNGRFDTNYVPITCQGRVSKERCSFFLTRKYGIFLIKLHEYDNYHEFS